MAAAAAWIATPRLALAKSASRPDLTGTWTNAWYTWLQRPKALKSLVLTPAEAEAFEGPRRRLRGELPDKSDGLGQNESEFPDQGPGLAHIRGEIRSSWITDPADGRIPWKAGVLDRLDLDPDHGDADNVEARDTDERCLTNSSATAPLTNSHDANLIQIVQTPGWVAIVGEKNHEIRIVRMIGADPPSSRAALSSWNGASSGRWEGATLVVETTGLRPGTTKVGDDLWLSDQARVTERFTRNGPGEIAYEFQVEDPTLFTRTWRGEEVFRKAEGRMFEYACHEGNYALPGILTGGQKAQAK